MTAQKFCSFLYVDGCPAQADGDFLRYLPTVEPRLVGHSLGQGRLYVAEAAGNPLHRHHVARCGDLGAFIQGEFYEQTDLSGLDATLADGRLDVPALARFLEGLNGAFSGFVVSGDGQSWAFGDRFGIGLAYVSRVGGKTLVSSHLWPALKQLRAEDSWYRPAFQEILLFGYPLADRTPLAGTRVIQPGVILHVSDAGVDHTPYHQYDRINRAGRRNHIQEFRDAAAAHFQSIRDLTGWQTFGSTLSGGHDSRVVVNAMLDSGLRPGCYIGYDNFPTWDSKRGVKVARAENLPYTVFDYQDTDPQDRLEANVLADGSGTASWSMNLAKYSAPNDDCLYFGTSGDPVSGGWKIFPHDFQDVGSMARAMMKAYYYEYAQPRADFLDVFSSQSAQELDARFQDSFGDGDDLVAAFLRNFYKEGNFRRVRMFMQGAYLYSAPVHFFHDRRLYEFYSSLPYDELIGQKVHNRLCYYRSFKMAMIPATNFPVPVMFEQWLLPVAKALLSKELRNRFRPMTRKTIAMKVELPEDIRRVLADQGQDIGLDFERFMRFLEGEERSGILVLRARYVKDMLAPDDLLGGSRLIGPKTVEQAGPEA